MAVSTIIRDRKFYNQYKNGLTFTNNLGDFTTNLTGSVGEIVKAVYLIDVSWAFSPSPTNGSMGISEIQPGVLKLSRPAGQKWKNEGFWIGDSIYITWTDNAGAQTSTGVVASVTNNIMIVNWGGFPIPGNINGWINNSTTIYGTSDLTSLEYGFGINENSVTNIDIASAVSGNDQEYYAGGIGLGGPRSTVFVPMQKKGQYQDWVTGSMQVRFVQETLLGGNPIIQQFEIEHIFMILPFFLDGELINLQNNIVPTILAGQNSLKYNFETRFQTLLTNPNTAKEFESTNNDGSVAWNGENFNGFNAEYKINSITYEDAIAASADGLLIGGKTTVKIEVEALNRVFVPGDLVGLYIYYLAGTVEYTNTILSDLKENFLYDNAFQIAGSAGAVGQDFISAFAVFAPVGSIMNLQFDVEYSAAQKLRLANLNSTQGPINFFIGIELGDNTLTSGNADRIIIQADVEEYDESADIEGLMNVTKYDIYPHNEQIGVGSGFTDLEQWIEDGVVVDYEFELDLNKQALLNSLNHLLFAYDPITKIYFELDNYSFNIFPATVSIGVQQLSLSATRGYILLAGDQFNDVTINTGGNAFNIQKYDGRIAQKVSWQDWLENLGVDTVFFDGNEPNDNLNYKASNYSLLNGYEIRMGFFANLFGVNSLNVGGLTDYLFPSPLLTTYDYEKDGNIPPIWTHLIETFEPNTLTNLGGAILTGQDTLFRCTWTHSGGPVVSLVGLWGINRIEKTNQPGYAIAEMSSLNLPPVPSAQQLLKPTGVLTLLDVTIVAGQVVMECLIDGNFTQANINYNLSSRIHDDNYVGGKQKTDGTLKQKTDNTVKQKAP